MEYRGSRFYDDPDNFKNYMNRRSWNENANDTIEKPIFMDLLGDISGKSILDLGCGDAAFGIELLHSGCSSYVGLEGSVNMVKRANMNLAGTDGQVIHHTIEDWDFPFESFDLVISRLVFHYIDQFEKVLKKIARAIKPGGRIIFSVEHPVMTSSYKVIKQVGTKTSWMVDNYFVSGEREQEWLGGKVKKYHRTIEEYFLALQKTGLIVEYLRESKPERKNFINQETFERRLKIPLFLFLAGRRENY